jgi:hypothetical protein
VSEDKGLLNIIHRLVADDDFRKRFVTIPKETLMVELGISAEAYGTLAALVPVLLAGGLFILEGGPSPDPGTPGIVPSGYGGW